MSRSTVARPSGRLAARAGLMRALLLCGLISHAWAAGAAGTPPLDPADPAWTQAPALTATLYPQATVPGGPEGGPVTLESRRLAGGGLLALRLTWPDATEDRADLKATHRFADAVAVQFAPPDAPLPYVGMGEPGRPVDLWHWRAGLGVERLSAQGFGSLAPAAGPAPEARAARTATGWAVVLRGAAPAVPALAFAAWGGADDGRAGRKRLSAWHALAAPASEAPPRGDAARGARLYAEHGCAACHAPNAGLGPDLAHAGGIHRPGYLRQAIQDPAAFVVPGYAAIMPALPLEPEAVEDLVAHLMSLK